MPVGVAVIGWMGTNLSHPELRATVNAIDGHYFSADSRWVVDAQLIHSDVDGVTGAGAMADINYRPQRGKQHILRATYFDDELDINELGFLTRNDQANLDYNYILTESNIEGLRSRTTSIFLVNQFNTELNPVRLGMFFNRSYNYLNNDTWDFSARFFPQRIDDRLGRGTGDFRIPARYGFNTSYRTDPTKPLSFTFWCRARPG